MNGFLSNAKMFLIWIVIFALGLVIYAYRSDVQAVGMRVWHEISPPNQVADGDMLRIRKSDDGHFWVEASVNGNQERFLVDSGASITGLSVGAATRSGVEASNGFPMILSTANGTVSADRATVDTLLVGNIERTGVGIVVAEEFGGTNVLGMNFLSSLSSWRVEDDTLILVP